MCLQQPSKSLVDSKADNAILLSNNANLSLNLALDELDQMLRASDEQSGLVHMVSMIKHLQIVRQETRSHQALSD